MVLELWTQKNMLYDFLKPSPIIQFLKNYFLFCLFSLRHKCLLDPRQMHLKRNLAQRRWINVSTNAALLILMLNAHLFNQHSTLGQKANAEAKIDFKSWTENGRSSLWRAYPGDFSLGEWTSCSRISSGLHNWQESMKAQLSHDPSTVWFHIEVIWGWDTSSPFLGGTAAAFS